MYIKKQKNIKKTRYRQKPLDLKNAEGLEKHTQSVVLSIGESAPVAQGIERRFPKPCVGGSNPLGSANLKPLENIDISVISAVFVLLFNSHLLRKCITERLFGVVLRGTPAVYA